MKGELICKLAPYRRKVNLSQRELAELIGCNQVTISYIEKGNSCNLVYAMKICKVLNLNMEQIWKLKCDREIKK